MLEIYLIRFLLVCSRKSSSLGTTFFNLYVAIYQLCSISGGLAADKLLGKSNSCDMIYKLVSITGNYYTQIFSNLVNTAGAILIALVTWQFTLSLPSCCHHGSSSSNDSHCYEVAKGELFSSVDMHFTSHIVMLLAAFGLIVC